ncbi:DUF6261 family protein [Fibrobacter intestinalis]|uniref:Uncharacterized protein n=1 Tax=Fibrobacter intestinalis TaxID=28122 RepID=A0A1T4LV86_9BACT|nr:MULTISPECIES: DUF6261 family protein [Fibrobacter]PBC75251.1 hypothetical protein BGW94_2937 [Fibrobacter sp. NR9]SJZ58643.1 hypothetical protein SAMN02745108_01040 [Fibrobacter intestinalis]
MVSELAAKNEAAQKLNAIFAKYGKSIVSASYAAESSLIESLLADFDKDEAKESAKALDGVPEILSQIREAQDAFYRVSDEYTAANAVKANSATSFKKPLMPLINEKLVPYLTAMKMANEAVFGYFHANAEKEIARINETVSRRSVKLEKADVE